MIIFYNTFCDMAQSVGNRVDSLFVVGIQIGSDFSN